MEVEVAGGRVCELLVLAWGEELPVPSIAFVGVVAIAF